MTFSNRTQILHLYPLRFSSEVPRHDPLKPNLVAGCFPWVYSSVPRIHTGKNTVYASPVYPSPSHQAHDMAENPLPVDRHIDEDLFSVIPSDVADVTSPRPPSFHSLVLDIC